MQCFTYELTLKAKFSCLYCCKFIDYFVEKKLVQICHMRKWILQFRGRGKLAKKVPEQFVERPLLAHNFCFLLKIIGHA